MSEFTDEQIDKFLEVYYAPQHHDPWEGVRAVAELAARQEREAGERQQAELQCRLESYHYYAECLRLTAKLTESDAIMRAAVAAEREACAQIAAEIEDSMAEAIAERIRARGEQR